MLLYSPPVSSCHYCGFSKLEVAHWPLLFTFANHRIPYFCCIPSSPKTQQPCYQKPTPQPGLCGSISEILRVSAATQLKLHDIGWCGVPVLCGMIVGYACMISPLRFKAHLSHGSRTLSISHNGVLTDTQLPGTELIKNRERSNLCLHSQRGGMQC